MNLSLTDGRTYEVRPTKIIAVGRNYRAHARELGNEAPVEPLLFFKPPSALIASGEPIVRPRGFGRVDYEGELAVIVGTRGRRIPAARAVDHILGLSCLNDVTCRELQRRERQWTRAKGFDTFCPFGPKVATGVSADDLLITTRKNGEVVQQARTSEMVFSIAEVIEYASRTMTLEAGDIIATGTPAGVGPIVAGDRIAIEIEHIGVLENPVVDEDDDNTGGTP